MFLIFDWGIDIDNLRHSVSVSWTRAFEKREIDACSLPRSTMAYSGATVDLKPRSEESRVYR